MIERMLFGRPTLAVLKRALDVYADRGRVHAQNVANAETPGYRAQEVRFEDDLRLALRTSSDARLASTDGAHLGPGDEMPGGKLVFRNPTSVVSGNGINDVEIDREMADIAANTLRYTVAAEKVRTAYQAIKKAIRGRAVA